MASHTRVMVIDLHSVLRYCAFLLARLYYYSLPSAPPAAYTSIGFTLLWLSFYRGKRHRRIRGGLRILPLYSTLPMDNLLSAEGAAFMEVTPLLTLRCPYTLSPPHSIVTYTLYYGHYHRGGTCLYITVLYTLWSIRKGVV